MSSSLRDEPERCLSEPHIFTAWSPYIPLQPRVEPMPTTPPTEPGKITAYRERLCRRCGVREQEDYYGERRVMDDPRGIEAAQQRRQPNLGHSISTGTRR